GSRLEFAPPPGQPWHHGLPGQPLSDTHPLRQRCCRGVRRSLDGSRLLLRLLGLDRAGGRTRTLFQLSRLAVGPCILPIDSLKLLAQERGGYVEVDTSTSMDWDSLRQRIAQHGMRNSNCVAIAPTATISNIVGVDASIEPC